MIKTIMTIKDMKERARIRNPEPLDVELELLRGNHPTPLYVVSK